LWELLSFFSFGNDVLEQFLERIKITSLIECPVLIEVYDLGRRLVQHNGGKGGEFTREQGPWELVYSEKQPNRTSAVRRERFLKSVDGSREKKRLAGSGFAL